MESYNDKALLLAEKYGIIEYRIKGKNMIYNKNYTCSEVSTKTGRWERHSFTMQYTINLDTLKVSQKRLKRLQQDGWINT